MLAGVDDDAPVPLQQPVEHLEVGDEVEHAVLADPPLLVERRRDEAGDSRSLDGSEIHEPLSVTANRYWSISPSTKTGIDTPALAAIIVPASSSELRR